MAVNLPPRLFLERVRLLLTKGQAVKVEEAVRNSESLHSTDADGATALHHCALEGDAELAKLLLDAGLSADVTDAFGYTPLHRAAAQGHREVIRLLVSRGCNVNLQDAAHGFSALHEAAWHGYSESLAILLDTGANVHVVNKAGFSALHLAAQNGHNQSARVLLVGGANADARNTHGDTALHTAARYGHAGVTRIFISARATVNEVNENGDTPLHIAAALKRRKVAQLLVDAGVDCSVRNKQGDTALDIATRKGHSQLVSVIHGALQPPGTLTVKFDTPAAQPDRPDTNAELTTEAVADKDARVKEKSKRGFFSNLFKRKKSPRKREETSRERPAVSANPSTTMPKEQESASRFRQPVYAPTSAHPSAPSFFVPQQYGYMPCAPHPATYAYYAAGAELGFPDYHGPLAPVPRQPLPNTNTVNFAAQLQPQAPLAAASSGRLVRSRSDESLSVSDGKAKANEERARKFATRELNAINQYYRYTNNNRRPPDANEPVAGRRGTMADAPPSNARPQAAIGARQPQFYVPQPFQSVRKRVNTRQRVPADVDDDDDDEDDASLAGDTRPQPVMPPLLNIPRMQHSAYMTMRPFRTSQLPSSATSGNYVHFQDLPNVPTRVTAPAAHAPQPNSFAPKTQEATFAPANRNPPANALDRSQQFQAPPIATGQRFGAKVAMQPNRVSQPVSMGSDNSNPDSGYASKTQPSVTSVFPPQRVQMHAMVNSAGPAPYARAAPNANATRMNSGQAPVQRPLRSTVQPFDAAALISMSTEV